LALIILDYTFAHEMKNTKHTKNIKKIIPAGEDA